MEAPGRVHCEKKRIYDHYADSLKTLGAELNPFDADTLEPSYWISCMRLDENSICAATRSEYSYTYRNVHGRTCPMEMLEALEAFGVESRMIWKPMHLQPMYRDYEFISLDGGQWKTHRFGSQLLDRADESRSLFEQCLCLPSDIKMKAEEQERVVEIICACFCEQDFERLDV